MAEGIPSYWSVIPAPVRNDPQLKTSAKLLYADISALCAETGYCWASNAYLAERFGVAVSTISRLVSQLEQRGYIHTEMATTDKGSERHIYAGIFPGSYTPGGSTQKEQDPPGGLRKKGKRGATQKEQPDNNSSLYNTPFNPPAGKKAKRQPKTVPKWKPERFEAFWAYYRDNVRGEARMAAVKAWDKLCPDDDLIDTIGRALKKQVRLWDEQGFGQPYASTYLNNRRWEDTPKESQSAPPGQVRVESGLKKL